HRSEAGGAAGVDHVGRAPAATTDDALLAQGCQRLPDGAAADLVALGEGELPREAVDELAVLQPAQEVVADLAPPRQCSHGHPSCEMSRHQCTVVVMTGSTQRILTIVAAVAVVVLLAAGVMFSQDGGDEGSADAGSSAQSSGGGGKSADEGGASEEEIGLVRRDADDVTAMGDVDAPVVLIEYSDYRCPFCGSFARDTMPELKEEYIDTGK